MNPRLVSLISIASFAAAPAFSQDSTQPGQDQLAEMMAYMEAVAPVKQHAMFKGLAGKWDADVTVWYKQGSPAMKSKGTAEYELTMGGRYVIQRFKSVMNGIPINGMGTLAFDRAAGEYVHTWIDNMGTGIMVTRGSQVEGKPQSIVMTGEMVDAVTKESIKLRITTDYGEASHEMTMFEVRGDAPEHKVMHIAYKKAAS